MTIESKSREALEREANQVRTKLLRTVEQLDQRRHQALDLRSQLERHAPQVAIGAGLLLTGTVVGVALLVHSVRGAGERRRRDRWAVMRRMWQHPERALRAERRSFFGDLGRALLISALSAGLAIPVRRTVALLADGLGPRAERATPGVVAR